MAKQFGLIVPEKNKFITRPSIFNDESDSDEQSSKPTGTATLKKKEVLAQEKAVAEDPTVYQYDELYDDMQSKRKESKLARKDLDKKPKYISKLLESAERRKRENERRIERQVQKEREEEGDMFKDKESYVTTAYRKKLEELKELEEKEKREEYLETIGDVRKQGDLSGFYRHLYAQQVNFEDNPEKDTDIVKTEEKSDINQEKSEIKSETNKRKYRKRENSKSDENESETEVKLQHLPSNLDADSDFSIDSDSDSENEAKKTKLDKVIVVKQEEETKDEDKKVEEVKEMPLEVKTETEDIKIIPEVPKQPKIDIWKKRTVNDVFDKALKRYYERKSAKIISI